MGVGAGGALLSVGYSLYVEVAPPARGSFFISIVIERVLEFVLSAL